ncbi:MAG: flagellar biosynthesis anti-sigma factor FlgM [Pyrinomonadaceae bacterium]|nr:flagellar biosynthesis anti-sigma factor FlgM [Pyrinomonadaceae bacterium]
MSININKTNSFDSVNNVQQKETKRTGEEALKVDGKPSVVSEDKIELSGKISEAGKYVEKLKELPDVRNDLVGFLRDKISTGDYSPSSGQIADAIIKNER